MGNSLKTAQNAWNWFLGYGGARLPHVDQRLFVPSCMNSRDLLFQVSPGDIARPASGFGFLRLGQSGIEAPLRGGSALAESETCSASTTASNSQNWENSDNIKTPLPASAGKGLRGLKHA